MQQRGDGKASNRKHHIDEITDTIILNSRQEFISEEFYSIDHDDTRLHDDALAITPIDKEWYRVFSAAAGISNKTNYDLSNLPRKFHESYPGARKHYSLSDQKHREAFIFSYYTDGKTIVEPSLQAGYIRSEAVSVDRVPVVLKRNMLHITQSSHVQKALGMFNTTFNYALAKMATQLGLPTIFYNKQQGERSYSSEPQGHENIGVDAYLRASTPIRRAQDRIALHQAFEAVRSTGSALNKYNIDALCEYFNKDLRRAA